jgi:hypothetical protein
MSCPINVLLFKIFDSVDATYITGGSCGHDRMVVGFTTTYAGFSVIKGLKKNAY